LIPFASAPQIFQLLGGHASLDLTMMRLKYLFVVVVVALAGYCFAEVSSVGGLLVFAFLVVAAGYSAAMLLLARSRFALATFAAVSWYASAFLTYLLPTFSDLLLWIGISCWLPMFFFSLSALFRRRWRAVAIFSATWIVVALPFLGVTRAGAWASYCTELHRFRWRSSDASGCPGKPHRSQF
jgi:hypothetical protein